MNNLTTNVTSNECVLRVYIRNADGFVDHEQYAQKRIDPTQAFPLGSFLIIHDYALEDQNGHLRWLEFVRVFKGKEYCQFAGQAVYEKRGKIIWSR